MRIRLYRSRAVLTSIGLTALVATLIVVLFDTSTSDAQVQPDPEAQHRKMLPPLESGGAVFTDFDESRGRLVVGVENKSLLQQAVQAMLADLGIPLQSVDIVETPRIYQLATLR